MKDPPDYDVDYPPPSSAEEIHLGWIEKGLGRLHEDLAEHFYNQKQREEQIIRELHAAVILLIIIALILSYIAWK